MCSGARTTTNTVSSLTTSATPSRDVRLVGRAARPRRRWRPECVSSQAFRAARPSSSLARRSWSDIAYQACQRGLCLVAEEDREISVVRALMSVSSPLMRAVSRRAPLEPLRPIGRGIGERRLARHHLGQQAAGHRAQREAQVMVAEVEPQAPSWRGARPTIGSMSGRHGRRPSHGSASTRSPSGKISRARRLDARRAAPASAAHRAARTRRPS